MAVPNTGQRGMDNPALVPTSMQTPAKSKQAMMRALIMQKLKGKKPAAMPATNLPMMGK